MSAVAQADTGLCWQFSSGAADISVGMWRGGDTPCAREEAKWPAVEVDMCT